MSANVYWRPIRSGKELDVNAPSSFLAGLTEAFGDLPIKMKCDVNTMATIRGMLLKDKGENDAYVGILRALNDHGEIEIFAEY